MGCLPRLLLALLAGQDIDALMDNGDLAVEAVEPLVCALERLVEQGDLTCEADSEDKLGKPKISGLCANLLRGTLLYGKRNLVA